MTCKRQQRGMRQNAKRSLASIVPAAVFDLDVSVRQSFANNPNRIIRNLVPNPADGSARSAYDFDLGIGGTSAPDFNNVLPGSPNASLRFDGGDYLQIRGGNTAFVNAMHDTTDQQDFTLAMALLYTDATDMFFASRLAGGAANEGFIFYTLTGNDLPYFTHRGTSVSSTANGTTRALRENDVNFVAMAYDHTAAEVTFWVNSSVGETVARSIGTVTADASGDFTIGAYADGSTAMANGESLYAAGCFNKVLSDAEMKAVIKEYERRHKRRYLL